MDTKKYVTRILAFVSVVSFVVSSAVGLHARRAQAVPSVGLGAQGRAETPGITRTTLKDDPKTTVTRVHFNPGALEPPHTHPYDVMIVAVTSGPVDFGIADKTIRDLKAGDVQFVPRDTIHHFGNAGREPFEVIAIAIK